MKSLLPLISFSVSAALLLIISFELSSSNSLEGVLDSSYFELGSSLASSSIVFPLIISGCLYCYIDEIV